MPCSFVRILPLAAIVAATSAMLFEPIEAIRLRLENGVDINATDVRGRTALHGAALKGYDQVVQFLADHGAKPDLRDKRGLTALDFALGKAGGLGFDGSASEPHPATAALLQKLMGL